MGVTTSRTAWVPERPAGRARRDWRPAMPRPPCCCRCGSRPVVAVAELIIALTPGDLAEQAHPGARATGTSRCWSAASSWSSCWRSSRCAGLLGPAPAWAGDAGLRRAGRGRRCVAVLTRPGGDQRSSWCPVLVGLRDLAGAFSWLTAALPPAPRRRPADDGTPGRAVPARLPDARRPGRRGRRRAPPSRSAGGWRGRGRRQVEEARRLLRLERRHRAAGSRGAPGSACRASRRGDAERRTST